MSRPASPQELFNLHYAQAHNVVKPAFGSLKEQFSILKLPLEFGMDIQAHIPPATSSTHNYILKHDSQEQEDIFNHEGENNPGMVSKECSCGTLAYAAPDAAQRT